MGRLVAVSLAIAFGASAVLADEFKIKDVCPSRLIAQILKGTSATQAHVYEVRTGDGNSMLPAGLLLKADDDHSKVTVEGPAEDVKQAAFLIRTFDVKSRTIRAQIDLDVPLEKYKSSTTTDIRNNSAWKLSDEAASLAVSFTPRLNADGTMTLFLTVDAGKDSYTMVLRGKQDQTLLIPLERPNREPRPIPNADDKDPNRPMLKIRLKALEPEAGR